MYGKFITFVVLYIKVLNCEILNKYYNNYMFVSFLGIKYVMGIMKKYKKSTVVEKTYL